MKKMLNFFLPKQKLSADGSNTSETLRAEKQRLETRFAQIPTTVANLQNSINLMSSDITWLGGLNNRRKKDWEKEKGKNPRLKWGLIIGGSIILIIIVVVVIRQQKKALALKAAVV